MTPFLSIGISRPNKSLNRTPPAPVSSSVRCMWRSTFVGVAALLLVVSLLYGIDASVICALAAEVERPPVKCTEDSPERRGQEGCTILANRPLVGSLAKPVYWHLDRFDLLEA